MSEDELHQRRSESARKAWTPERRAKQSEAIRRAWRNPDSFMSKYGGAPRKINHAEGETMISDTLQKRIFFEVESEHDAVKIKQTLLIDFDGGGYWNVEDTEGFAQGRDYNQTVAIIKWLAARLGVDIDPKKR